MMPPKGWKKTTDPDQPAERPDGNAPPPPPVPNNTRPQPIIESGIEEKTEIDNTHSFLPPKDLFRVDEVARHLDISERCVRLWLDHGHLEGVKIVGSIRITRESIIRCVEKYIPNRVRIS